jgi:orotidine-5'-phosphate decarboxylase
LSFKQELEHYAETVKSHIILALDPQPDEPGRLLRRSMKILEAVHPYICALKINRQLLLPLGLFNGVQTIVNKAHDLGILTIMDAKINDIGNTNRVMAEYYYKAGFDALIASPFIGWEEGLQPVFDAAKKKNRGVIILVYMSHKGAVEGYGQMLQDPITKKFVPQYRIFAEKALKWNADGVVVGATVPSKIREVNALLREKVPIYSPGIGAQGGDIEAALKAGAKYLIVGRAIVDAKNSAAAAEHIRSTAWENPKNESVTKSV